MKLKVTAASNVGCVRKNNEDMILAGCCFIRNDEYHTILEIDETQRYLVAVADGMGGHNSGEVASSDTLHNLQFYFNDIPSGVKAGDFNEMFVGWLESINHIIDAKGRADTRHKGMGTTLVGLAFYEGEVYSMNCGDSRLYRYRDGSLVQLTTDHSLNNMLGLKKHTSVITNCIGGGCNDSFLDMVRLTGNVKSGDLYMLCSDGLSDMVSNRQLSALLAKSADATALCQKAIDAGGFDNVSVCTVQIE